jgi:hypothetical protein
MQQPHRPCGRRGTAPKLVCQGRAFIIGNNKQQIPRANPKYTVERVSGIGQLFGQRLAQNYGIRTQGQFIAHMRGLPNDNARRTELMGIMCGFRNSHVNYQQFYNVSRWLATRNPPISVSPLPAQPDRIPCQPRPKPPQNNRPNQRAAAKRSQTLTRNMLGPRG